MSDREKQQRVYDRFRTYVHNNMRDNNNRLTVTNFSNIPRPGPTHLRIELENCFSADADLFRLVKEFHPEASLVVKENVLEKGSRYIANIPWTQKPKRKRKKHYDDDDDDDTMGVPNPITPMLWTMGLMATMVAASFTTDLVQWKTLFGY